MDAIDFKVIVRGDAEAFQKAIIGAQKKVATNVNRRAARRTRNLLRAEVRSTFNKGTRGRLSGAKFEKTILVSDQPKRGFDFNNASAVYSVARYRKGRSAMVDLLTIFADDRLIKARSGKYLAIPTKDAPTAPGGRRAADPTEYRGPKQFIKLSNALAMIIDPRTRRTLWWLVSMVTLRRRLNPFVIHQRSVAKMPSDYEHMIEVETASIVRRYDLIEV